jgi:hypothetical protein
MTGLQACGDTTQLHTKHARAELRQNCRTARHLKPEINWCRAHASNAKVAVGVPVADKDWGPCLSTESSTFSNKTTQAFIVTPATAQ